jgi:hypothetical protein
MALADLIGGGIGSLAEKIGGVVDRFVQTKDEKAAVMLEIEKLAQQSASELEETMRAELGAKERVMIAELNQGDTYTKRARPTVVYFGLGVIAFNYSFTPVMTWIMSNFSSGTLTPLPAMELPVGFWAAWGGVVGTWSVGRTMERRGSNNNLVQMITGNKARDTLSDKVNVKSILD